MNKEILYLLSNRQRWKQYADTVKKHWHVLSEETNDVIKLLPEWYELSPKDDLDWDEFSTWFCLTKHAGRKQEWLDLRKKLFQIMWSFEPEEKVYQNIIGVLLERSCAEEVAHMASEVAQGSTRYGMEDLKERIDEWNETQSPEDSLIVSDDFNSLVSGVMGTGLNWKQKWMNESCGPLRKADFVVLAKRPDTGGTSFLSGQANAFAHQLPADHPVLWFNNEQEGKKVKLRIIQEGIDWTNEQIMTDPETAKESYENQVAPLNRIMVIDKPGMTCADVERFCDQYKPGAIIIDQLWKMQGKGDISDVKTQTEIANWARELCKVYAPVIGVYQLGGPAEGEAYPQQNSIYMSATAVQGEADLIVCMGRVHDEAKKNLRFFHFPKNKMAGGGDLFIPSMKQAKHESVFNEETGVFR